MSAGAMEIRARHWGLALLAALILHGAFLGWLALRADRPGALAAGVGGIQVSLGPTGGTPGEASEVTPEETPGAEEAPPDATEALPPEVQAAAVESAQETEPVEAPQEVAEAVEPVEAVTAEAAPAEVPIYAPVEPIEAPEQKPEEIVAEVPEAVAEEAPEVVEEVTVAEVEPAREVMETPPPPPTKPAPPVEKVAEPAPPEPEPVAEPAATAEAAAQETAEVASAPAATSEAPALGDPNAAVQGNDGKAGIGKSSTTGSASAQSAGGNPGDYVDYAARLLAWLQKHKKYPRRAKMRGYQGTAWLTFVIDRDGRLLEYNLDEGTGHKLLDKEVAAMIERASPLPAPPPGGQEDRFTYRVPVGFNLQ